MVWLLIYNFNMDDQTVAQLSFQNTNVKHQVVRRCGAYPCSGKCVDKRGMCGLCSCIQSNVKGISYDY